MKIRTCVSAKEEPAPITLDSKGNPISLRARVAYNLSGGIEIGYIDSIEKNGWRKVNKGLGENFMWGTVFEILIENEETGKISKIKNPNSFIVL